MQSCLILLTAPGCDHNPIHQPAQSTSPLHKQPPQVVNEGKLAKARHRCRAAVTAHDRQPTAAILDARRRSPPTSTRTHSASATRTKCCVRSSVNAQRLMIFCDDSDVRGYVERSARGEERLSNAARSAADVLSVVWEFTCNPTSTYHLDVNPFCARRSRCRRSYLWLSAQTRTMWIVVHQRHRQFLCAASHC